MENPESKIIKRIQNGELELFGQLYDNYLKKIYSFIYYKTMHKETAEDLTSKTFFKALDNIKKYDINKGNFSSWLYKIARNNVIDHYRTKKPETNIDDFWGLSSNQDIESEIDINQKLEDVKKYLQKLKADQREIVIMRLWDNLSYQEISDITGKTVASCKMTFSRVTTKLREEMALVIFYLIIFTKQILWLMK